MFNIGAPTVFMSISANTSGVFNNHRFTITINYYNTNSFLFYSNDFVVSTVYSSIFVICIQQQLTFLSRVSSYAYLWVGYSIINTTLFLIVLSFWIFGLMIWLYWGNHIVIVRSYYNFNTLIYQTIIIMTVIFIMK